MVVPALVITAGITAMPLNYSTRSTTTADVATTFLLHYKFVTFNLARLCNY